MEPQVAIVLLNYNGWHDTVACLESLARLTYPNYSTVVVDNASTQRPPDLVQRVKNLTDTFIQSPRNGGFAAGNNLGIDYALDSGADLVLLLNNDTVVQADFLSLMVAKVSAEPQVGILGCRILYHSQPDRVWYNGAGVDWHRGYGFHYDENRLAAEVSYRSPIDYVTGCVMLIRPEVFAKCGKLKDEYFMYFEDMVLSLSARQAGFKLDYVPEAIVYHKVAASGGGAKENWVNVYYGNLSRRIFLRSKFYQTRPSLKLFATGFFYITRVFKLLKFLVKGDFTLFKYLVKAMVA